MSLYSWKDDIRFKKEFLPFTSTLTLVDPDRLYVLYQLVHQIASLEGEFAEVGVYRGGTAKLIYEVSRSLGWVFSSMFLCDTFEGMPETDKEKDRHRKGDFSNTSQKDVSNLFANPYPELIKGIFPESVGKHKYFSSSSFSMVHVDCDIYTSVRDCCNFFYTRMLSGGVIVFDDYGFPSCPGAKEAVDEFFKDKTETPIYITTGQCLVFKL